jgi:phosphatidate cytidylyltransferase
MIMVAGYGLIHMRAEFGFVWLLWLVAVVVVTDVGGYFAGRFLGGPKFWPRVSPKKTWAGTIAGWIGAALVGLAFAVETGSGYELIGVSVAVSMASQLGDIAESAVKRRHGVKDSSSLLPGHGGIFDRFDGMLGAAVFFLLVEQLVDFPPVPL